MKALTRGGRTIKHGKRKGKNDRLCHGKELKNRGSPKICQYLGIGKMTRHRGTQIAEYRSNSTVERGSDEKVKRVAFKEQQEKRGGKKMMKVGEKIENVKGKWNGKGQSHLKGEDGSTYKKEARFLKTRSAEDRVSKKVRGWGNRGH